MPYLTAVSTAELYSWQPGTAVVRTMASRVEDIAPPEVAAWLNEHGVTVTAGIGRRSR
jgi:hypothetical protein